MILIDSRLPLPVDRLNLIRRGTTVGRKTSCMHGKLACPQVSFKGRPQGVPAHRGEEHDMGLQQRDGDVPRVVRLAQEADELAGDLGLRLAQADALQQRLQARYARSPPHCYEER